MRYKLHGRSGLRVSELCLGTMTFGSDAGWAADAPTSHAMFDLFAEAGGTFIDTAHMYTDGESERLVGEFIRADRDHFVVATKYTPHGGSDVSRAGNSRKNMMRCVEDSLRRLGTDHIDLYYIHYWDATTPIEEIMRGLHDLVAAGKVLYVAASNLNAWRIAGANVLADLRGWSPFIGVQIEYNLIQRSAEHEIIPMAEELDIGVTAWSPLAQGVLSGKYLEANASGRQQPDQIEARSLAIARTVVDVARDLGRSPVEVALAAIMQLRPEAGVIPIVGGRNAEQLTQCLGAIDLRLAPEHLRILDEATAITLGVPYTTNDHPYMKELAYGSGNRALIDNHRARRLGRLP